MLPENFKEPSGFEWGAFISAKGASIRYGSLQPEGMPKGAVVFVPGFGEPIEKEFEIARDMTGRGFAVWIMDRRGQGGSGRFSLDNPQKAHSEEYEEHIETLRQFAEKIVRRPGGAFILMGHSMGAHIGLRYLKEHAGVFNAAVFTAPNANISRATRRTIIPSVRHQTNY